MPLSPDDPAREKILAMRARVEAGEKVNVMEELETYEVTGTYLVKALSPGHAEVIVGELVQHTIDTHLSPGTFALTGVKADPAPLDWLTGPLQTLATPEQDGEDEDE